MSKIIKYILIKFLKIFSAFFLLQLGAFIAVFLTPLLVGTHNHNTYILLVLPFFISIGSAIIIIVAKVFKWDDLWDFREFYYMIKKLK